MCVLSHGGVDQRKPDRPVKPSLERGIVVLGCEAGIEQPDCGACLRHLVPPGTHGSIVRLLTILHTEDTFRCAWHTPRRSPIDLGCA